MLRYLVTLYLNLDDLTASPKVSNSCKAHFEVALELDGSTNTALSPLPHSEYSEVSKMIG